MCDNQQNENAEKRNFWTDTETELMLDVFIEKEIFSMFDGKKIKNAHIYKLIHSEMLKHGMANKSSIQIQNKWKTLKSKYTKTIKKNLTRREAMADCEFYEKLDKILSTRPSTLIEGVDSLPPFDDTAVYVDNQEEIEEVLSPTSSSSRSMESITDIIDQQNVTPALKRKRRMRSVNSSLNKRDQEYFRHSEKLMQSYMLFQKEQDEIEAKRKEENLNKMLLCFTSAVEKLVTPLPQSSPQQVLDTCPSMLYPYQADSPPSNNLEEVKVECKNEEPY